MHDPMTVAWELKRPWPVKGGLGDWKYYPSIATVWHVDPEKDGSDDSCGWSSPKLTKEEIEKAQKIARFEMKYLFDECGDGKFYIKDDLDPIAGIYTVYQTVSWQIFRKRIKPKHLPEILSLSSHPFDNFRHNFTNEVTQYDIERMFIFIAKNFKRMERRWYQHPRYHFWHFKIQIPLIQNIKRFLWGRCGTCGMGLGWNKSVVSHSWDSEGPQWFRSERNVECYRHHGVAQAETAAAGASDSKALNTLGNE